MPLHSRKRWVAAKIESVKGTLESFAAGDAKILAFDPEIMQETEFEERAPAGIAMGRLAGVPSEHAGRARIRVEVRGSGSGGTLPVWAQTLLLASSMSSASGGTCSLVSDFDDQPTVSLAVYKNGKREALAGAMCNAVIEGETGKRVFIEFDIRGIWQAPVDAAAPSPITHETTKPLQLKSATFTIGGDAKRIGRFRLDFGNDVQLRMNQAKATAIEHAYLANRSPTVQFDPEDELVADEDYYGAWIAGTTAALALNLGGTTGNQVNIAAPRVQYIDPNGADRNRIQTLDMNGQLNADAGDDEFTIAFP